jgi:hypothetical protein
MRKLVILLIVLGVLLYWFKDFIHSGGFERYLDTHYNAYINPAVEYCWGMVLNLADRKQSAGYRFSRVAAKYPKSEYAPLAWAEYIEILDGLGDRSKMLEESKKFMESDYATHPKAEIIKRKIALIEHGY